jgi:hypothetical protein
MGPGDNLAFTWGRFLRRSFSSGNKFHT